MFAVSTWEGDPVSLCATILKGIARLLDTYGEGLRADLFVERLSRVPVKEIIRSARERNNGSLGYAEALLTFYNKRTRYPLRWSNVVAGNFTFILLLRFCQKVNGETLLQQGMPTVNGIREI